MGTVEERLQPDEETPLTFDGPRTRGDRVFRALAVSSAALVLLLIGLIGLFLVLEARPALGSMGWRFLTEEAWAPDGAARIFGVRGVLVGTVLVAVMALSVALPLSIAGALAINWYAPVRWRQPLITLVDVLAVLPSLIYGLWGKFTLQPRLDGVSRWLADHAGFVPLFRVDEGERFGMSLFVCGMVVGIMIVPIVTSVSREVMASVPRVQCEAAYALGGTRWAMVRDVVLPFGRNGIIGGAVLGLGRALGETVAVAMILSVDYKTHLRVLQPGGGTLSALIANSFGDAQEIGRSALAAAALCLFVLTLAVNSAARLIVTRTTGAGGRGL